MLFASDFSGLLPFILGLPVVITLLGLISFIPASYGHWSALVLAIPCAALGLLLTYVLFADGRPDTVIPVLWILFPAPLVVGGASIRLWRSRRRTKRSE